MDLPVLGNSELIQIMRGLGKAIQKVAQGDNAGALTILGNINSHFASRLTAAELTVLPPIE